MCACVTARLLRKVKFRIHIHFFQKLGFRWLIKLVLQGHYRITRIELNKIFKLTPLTAY